MKLSCLRRHRRAAFFLLALGTGLATQASADAPRWWCQPVKAVGTASAPVVTEALAHLDTRPAPLAHLHTQGLLPHQGIHDASAQAEQDWPLALRAAVTWRLSRRPELLHQTIVYLDAWAHTYEPDFNPIDETNIDQLFSAYVLTYDALPGATRSAVAALARKLATGYLQRLRQRAGSTYINDINNWQSHRIKLLATTAAALGDPTLIEAARAWLQTQVAANIRSDGSTVDFAQRDALHYVVYDLEPLVQAALALKPYGGTDLLDARSANGGSIEAALDWLTPYAAGEREHQEFVHTSEPFDIERRQAGLKGYGGNWDPSSSGALYAYAAVLAPKYHALAVQLGVTPTALLACATPSSPDTSR